MSKEIKHLDTKKLFTEELKAIKIIHNGAVYILRITKDNKLILTKYKTSQQILSIVASD
jgi:hemin uptake protein HemP